MEPVELSAWLRLSVSDGVGRTTARRLLTAFGSPEAVFDQSLYSLAQHVTPAQARSLLVPPEKHAALLDATTHWLAQSGEAGLLRAVAPLGHVWYPPALLEIEDPPLMLYLLGAQRWLTDSRCSMQRARSLAIVGSRNPTPQGRETTLQFAQSLREAGLSIVSGLALGIDAAAHEGALAAAFESDTPVTVAVVGTGLDRVYPSRHLDLARRIAANGLILSEYPVGTPPLAANFPRRNRIISGLSHGVLVVEAAPASGSLITARMASEQGRDVFAVPGSIHAVQSRGCHALIKQGAKLVESAADVLEEFPAAVAMQPTPAGAEPARRASALLNALGFDPLGLDTLQARTGLDTASLQVQLLELELESEVARLPGGFFQRQVRA
ncbi:DNA-processing protein DprA [Simplicispira suum]|uniref:DNA-protecting protein DprA n=1 Tax=Simplicispira suum TaxID=2109915 RepID=A0A2S0MZR7_9BURK|nr:DNA-processing protein DprA [Simplicispira suum]AVO41375.1 DNA-protecting protein DprA [Simplicispira suum]